MQRQPPSRTEPLVAIVDDDGPLREALRRMLKADGIATELFASAEQFLRSSRLAEASCLILDVRMPGLSGLELHDYLVAQGCRIPTILITACPTSAERKRALASGAAFYLAKPFAERALLDAVREALGHGHRVGRETSPS